jgi:hypothetical protein
MATTRPPSALRHTLDRALGNQVSALLSQDFLLFDGDRASILRRTLGITGGQRVEMASKIGIGVSILMPSSIDPRVAVALN